MSSPFLILGISPTNDQRAIKRSYAAALKLCHPEDNPEGFKNLRTAYEKALEGAKAGWWIADDDQGEIEEIDMDVNEVPADVPDFNLNSFDSANASKQSTSATADFFQTVPPTTGNNTSLDINWTKRPEIADLSTDENKETKSIPPISWSSRVGKQSTTSQQEPSAYENTYQDPRILVEDLLGNLSRMIADNSVAIPEMRDKFLLHAVFEHFEAKSIAEAEVVKMITAVDSESAAMPGITELTYLLDKVYVWFGHDRRLIGKVSTTEIDRLLEIVGSKRKSLERQKDLERLAAERSRILLNEATRRWQHDSPVALYGTATYLLMIVYLAWMSSQATLTDSKKYLTPLWLFLAVSATLIVRTIRRRSLPR